MDIKIICLNLTKRLSILTEETNNNKIFKIYANKLRNKNPI